jgi:acyl-CoA hydrolase
MSSPPRRTPFEILDLLEPGQHLFLPGNSGESLAFQNALTERPEKADGICFVAAHFPGINRSNYPGLHPGARQKAFFMQPHLAPALAEGRVELFPLDYPKIFTHLRDNQPIDIAVTQVAPPDSNGRCSLGLTVDFQPAVWEKARLRVAHINPLMPPVASSFSISLSDCDYVTEMDSPLVTLAAENPGPDLLALGRHVASLVRDGDTIQFGVGKVQTAILRSLSAHQNLSIYSGMVSTPVLDLIDNGNMRSGRSVEAGVALGTAEFYSRLSNHPALYFRPVSETHDVRRIAGIQNFVSINSALEVDLFGQVNAETLAGTQIGGVGGLPAFVQGSALSPGGRSIICCPSASQDGTQSRIVPRVRDGNLVAVTRADVDYVVTEQGTAALRSLSVAERARALIAIAAPQFREGLERSWREAQKGRH